MRTGLVRKTEEDRVVELMCNMLELCEASETVVKAAVQEHGVKEFFDTFEELAIEDNEKERIKALKEVIDTKEQEIMLMEGAK